MTARDVLGLPPEDVGALYGLSEGNQRVLLHRARSQVRGAVEAYVRCTDPAGSTPRSDVSTAGRPSVPSGGLHPGERRAPRRPRPGQQVVCQQLVELVDDYLDGALDPDLRRRVEEHLAACDGCSGYVAQVRKLLDTTCSLVDSAPPVLVARLVRALRRGGAW